MPSALVSSVVLDAFTPDRLAETLLGGFASPYPHTTAAVAAVMRDGPDGAEALFIERAKHPLDPWSGHMAFPGGRTDPGDDTSWSTAARETLEEVGIDLSRSQLLGRLSDVEGRPVSKRGPMRVTPHVCWLTGETPPAVPNYEVAQVLWVPMAVLADRARFIDYRPAGYAGARFPGIQLDGHQVVWGLTLRMLEDLFTRAGHPLDVR